jgi:tetratricopeptide (TPR) repeat protein
MMNKPKLMAALVLSAAAGLALYPLHARAADKDKKPEHTVSTKDYAKYLKAAQEAEQAGNYREALAQLDKARALPKPTPWDTHLINALAFSPYAQVKDMPNAAKSLEALTNDGFSDPAEVNKYVKNLAVIYYQLKDYPKAIEYGNRAIKAGVGDANTHLLVSQAYYIKGDYAGTMHFTDAWVNDEIKQGQTPKEEQLNLILSSCVKLNDASCEQHALERMVKYYPKPEYWDNLISSLFQSQQAASSDALTLNIYRLASDVNAIQKASGYLEMAQLALEQGSPGDAQHILEAGNAKNMFTDPRDKERAQRVLTLAKKRAAEDQAALPKLESEAQSAPTGDKAVAVGMAYLGYQQYDKAAEALSEGLMKGSVRDEGQARLLLGIAQLKSGKKDEALKTFHAVSGNPTLVRLANLWSLRASGPEATVAAN